MATKEELYVSISPDIYRVNKSNVLMSQADFLGTLKKLHNLKVLERQKQELRKKLYKLFTLVLSEINLIQRKMPTPDVPKTVHLEKKLKTKGMESFPRRDNIEEELKIIQKKLRELNS
mgnify:CR=1 FL=1